MIFAVVVVRRWARVARRYTVAVHRLVAEHMAGYIREEEYTALASGNLVVVVVDFVHLAGWDRNSYAYPPVLCMHAWQDEQP